jgi:hypothetical protein
MTANGGVLEAIGELRWLTECRCHPDWTERNRHETHCASDYRADVNTVTKALRQAGVIS